MTDVTLPREGDTLRLESGDSKITIVRSGSRSVIGDIVVARDDGTTLRIERLCVGEEHRGFGVGSEAFHLLLGAASEAGWQKLRAVAPDGFGLAVYFWMRMGFRPLFGQIPGGGIALERSVPK